MPLPPGVITRTVQFGPAQDFWGNTLTDGYVTFVPTVNLVYSGTPLLITPERVALNGSGIASATLVCTDQSGFTDGDANPITNWRWRVRVKVTNGPSYTKFILVPDGVGALDVDVVPDVGSDGATVVVSGPVLSVNGLTGHVTVGAGGVPVPAGGTTGQALVKNSNTSGDVGWGSAGAVNGKSAYQLAVDAGYSGTESQWLASLTGATGATGPQGPPGGAGPTGATGSPMSVRIASGGVYPARVGSGPAVHACADTAVQPTSPVVGDLLYVYDSSSSL